MISRFLVATLTIYFFFISSSLSQKKIIDHQAFDGWKTLKNDQISASGKYITYEIQPHKGDTYLYIYNTKNKTLDSIHRAKNATFSHDEKFLIYTIEAGYDTLRKVELDKIDKKKWPKDSLAIYTFETKNTIKIANVKSHQLGEKHNWLTYLENDNKLKEEKNTETKKRKFFKKKKTKQSKKEKEPKSDGKVLRILQLENDQKFAFKNITSYSIDEKGQFITFVEHQNDSNTIKILDLTKGEIIPINKKITSIENISIDKKEKRFVFLGSQDTTKTKIYELYHYNFSNQELSCLIDTTTENIPKEWTVVKGKKPIFSEVHNQLYFGVNEIPIREQKDTLTESEKPKFDLWTYNEPILQTQQITNLKNEQNKAYWYTYDFNTNQITAIENDSLNIQRNFYELKEYALSHNSKPYELEFMWDISGKKDYYLTNIKTGQHQLIKKSVTYAVPLSRKGDQFVYFNHLNGQYYNINLNNKEEKCITCYEKNKTWHADNNGMPMEYTPIGNQGWNKDGTQLFISEKHDFFLYDFSKNELINLTENKGEKSNIEFTARKWNSDSTFTEIDNFYLIGLDKTTKGSHFYQFTDQKLNKIAYWDEKITSLKKAKNEQTYSIRKQSITNYPDLFFWKDNIEQLAKISTTNPQQIEYNWATVELISWKTYKGLELEGLVYKPENYSPNKQYPLLVYYYELYSDDLHNHYTPRPTASIIFPTEYASADYIVFIPDIRYEAGYPARSAYDCIMSGTDAVLKKYPNIDSTRMGLQGQSWGGYQTAQLVTMTSRFKAAMAGAPVGNMFSAYGGIRWGSGMSRQFQYEKTQSRIGKTMWEAPELYIENSPVFHLPKVKTPLLIMHNDNDGAVPWYQGIEIFTGMRRLGKPCWLLNYNGDEHNLMKTANRRDLSIRMRQFFDHYLQNQPAPRWMSEGIPALKKGKELRYELEEN